MIGVFPPRACFHIRARSDFFDRVTPRSLSEYSPVLPHCPWVSLGLSLFGHGPRARRALSPPQLVAVLQERRQIFRRLWVKQISCHSADTFSSPRNKNFLALASWCAGSVIKQPCEPVLVTYAPGAYGPDAKCRVHRCAARLPARPRPAPLGATNSSPGLCSVPIPPSRCISPPVCSRSITPPVAVAGSRGCTLSSSPGTR